jgi:three-Cys-motif partner protein
VGAWAEEKYQLVLCYATIVAKSMSKKPWQGLVYLDLFAGAGRARIAGTQQIIPASPLLVLGIQNGFGTHIFCELDQANANALRTRTAAAAAGRRVVVVEGDTNANVDTILSHIPERSLTFCFVDPFAIAPLQFTTIRRLADARRMDFLVLLATGMDVTRNERLYTRPEDRRVSEAVGHDNWRARWPQLRMGFGDFVADEFGRSMATLGYHYSGLADTEEIDNGKNAPIYRLAFFSRHPLGDDFWKKCRRSADPNRRLF